MFWADVRGHHGKVWDYEPGDYYMGSHKGHKKHEKRYIKIYKEGNSFFSIGEFEKAIDSYKKSIKLNPNYCNSYFKLGISYKNLENYSLYKNTFKNSFVVNTFCY